MSPLPRSWQRPGTGRKTVEFEGLDEYKTKGSLRYERQLYTNSENWHGSQQNPHSNLTYQA